MSDSNETNERQSTASNSANSAAQGVLAWLRERPAAWRGYLNDLSQKPTTRFMTILWAVCAIFLGITILSASNPLLLLFPGQVFAVPFQDLRPNIEFRGIARTTGKLVAYQRPVQEEASVEANVRKYTFLVSEPVGLSETSLNDKDYADLEPLPRLGFALRRAWFRGEPSGQLILDFRRDTLLKETSLFHKNRFRASEVPAEQDEGDDEEDKKKAKEREQRRKRSQEIERAALAHYLDLYFRALTATIFAAKSEVKSVLYLLDGEADTIDEMEFDLDVRYARPGTGGGE